MGRVTSFPFASVSLSVKWDVISWVVWGLSAMEPEGCSKGVGTVGPSQHWPLSLPYLGLRGPQALLHAAVGPLASSSSTAVTYHLCFLSTLSWLQLTYNGEGTDSSWAPSLCQCLCEVSLSLLVVPTRTLKFRVLQSTPRTTWSGRGGGHSQAKPAQTGEEEEHRHEGNSRSGPLGKYLCKESFEAS